MMDASLGAPQRAPAESDHIRAQARHVAAQAPPLTAEQRGRLATLLCGAAPARAEVAGGAA